MATEKSIKESLQTQSNAASYGFDWENPHQIIDKIREELTELSAEIEIEHRQKIEEEYGDLLLAVINLARHLKINPEQALDNANQKFSSRFEAMIESANNQAIDFKSLPLEKKEALWQSIKHLTNPDS
jgi:uncharacterized protein YabN with tetrapyrrole methylase and pyrophosphatase domain